MLTEFYTNGGGKETRTDGGRTSSTSLDGWGDRKMGGHLESNQGPLLNARIALPLSYDPPGTPQYQMLPFKPLLWLEGIFYYVKVYHSRLDVLWALFFLNLDTPHHL